ncbi:hypothetical protein B1A87_001015 [Arthrobacter sp. KBS0703]|uniref:hypothetical protein n=1 Tax=Arthrobacter sp. KBS0703 TaxID=1955698 RepID=UPI0009900960|nr:hypothetical protein [Arthrobacter sp. KBS0703]TSE14728.1 hypothetical protein B1A87_001015 [Arthrobacter sp. KBS0703]
MKTGISAAIRRFIEQHIVADDPYPERSWLDRQDMPRQQLAPRVAVAGLPVEPLPPLPQRFGHGRDRRPHYRVWGSHRTAAHQADGTPTGDNVPR